MLKLITSDFFVKIKFIESKIKCKNKGLYVKRNLLNYKTKLIYKENKINI